MKSLLHLFLGTTISLSLGLVAPTFAVEGRSEKAKTENKNITVISAESKADGSSDIRKEKLRECIVSLPTANELEADLKSEGIYLHEINGDATKNEFVKTYSARIEINYLVYEKELIIVTTKSIQGQEPVMKEVEKRVKESKEFLSNSSEGDIFAGKSNRQYYFTKSEDALKDVKKRAAIWLNQQSSVLCRDK